MDPASTLGKSSKKCIFNIAVKKQNGKKNIHKKCAYDDVESRVASAACLKGLMLKIMKKKRKLYSMKMKKYITYKGHSIRYPFTSENY